MTTSQTAAIKKLDYAHGKQLAQLIFHETMAAIDVRHAMLAKLKFEDGAFTAGGEAHPLVRPPRVVAFGKAANRMAMVLDEILGGRIEAGVSVAPAETPKKLANFQYFVGGHPYPNIGSLEGARASLGLVSHLMREDTVIFLVSGGGSAILAQPMDESITLADLIEFNRALVTSHLPIEEINVLRKHVSAVKGGRLAERAYPAGQLTIFISDVPDDLPSMVASGPTMPDESTTEQAYELAEQSNLAGRFPASIRGFFERRELPETPKPGDPRFANSYYVSLLANRDAVAAALSGAEKLGFVAEIDRGIWDADYQQVVHSNVAALDALSEAHKGQAVCLVVGGEVTCPVTGPGIGGRNQAFALYAAQQISGQRRVVLSAGTDGRDGNSPTSGAVADGQTFSRAQGRGLDPAAYLAGSDAYSFFRTLGDTLDTGFTDNNVRDVRIWLDFGA
ncbi:MAG: glycerate kinase [Terriglobia bacterium]